jgi:hypothetical protein
MNTLNMNVRISYMHHSEKTLKHSINHKNEILKLNLMFKHFVLFISFVDFNELL